MQPLSKEGHFFPKINLSKEQVKGIALTTLALILAAETAHFENILKIPQLVAIISESIAFLAAGYGAYKAGGKIEL